MKTLDSETVDALKKGRTKLAQVYQVNAKQLAALLLVGQNLYLAGRLEEARKLFEGLATLDGRNPYVHCILGSIYQKLGKDDIAAARYTLALNYFPQDINALANRGEIFLKHGKMAEAAEDIEKAIALDPEKKNPAANRARLLAVLTYEGLKVTSEKGIGALHDAKKRLDKQLNAARS